MRRAGLKVAEWEMPAHLLEGSLVGSWWGPWHSGRSRLELGVWELPKYECLDGGGENEGMCVQER